MVHAGNSTPTDTVPSDACMCGTLGPEGQHRIRCPTGYAHSEPRPTYCHLQQHIANPMDQQRHHHAHVLPVRCSKSTTVNVLHLGHVPRLGCD